MTDEVLERIYSVLLRIEADIGRIRWEALLAEQRGKLVVAPAQQATNSTSLSCSGCVRERLGTSTCWSCRRWTGQRSDWHEQA